MTTTAEIWRIDVIAEGDRMTAAAMCELHDANAARALVHDVMWRAMTDMLGPVSPSQLDSALGQALHAHCASAANDA